ncbi:family 78 glycoside hydrolase catalytic domain [Nocardioides dongkuii]|uniref:family 78 glycoside hydrolase catalytic domain n=1 Tax=Nocardioides dongkuii TaxID=2760089 RepID=UPI0015FE33B3|nr:family 78 glycoside hydrolase catalytic domain [Nocardioides dongkuii]
MRRSTSTLAVLALMGGLATAVPPSAGAASPAATAASAAAEAAEVQVSGLTTNGRTDPLGIPGATPSLGWKATSTARGVEQSAYQVRVASDEDALAEADVWDSGKVASSRQVDVAYGGPALTSQTRYIWQVRTWDGSDTESAWSEPASFETGMLDASDWDSAQWVGGATGDELARWTDYTATFDFRIDNLVFGTYVRAADLNNGYMWQLNVANGTPRFRPHKKTNGGYALMAEKDISSTISAADLRTGFHTMEVTFDGNLIVTTLDGKEIDRRTDSSFRRGFVGFRTDTATEGAEAQTVRDVRVVAKTGEVLLDTDFASGENPFTGGTLTPEGYAQSGRADTLWRVPEDNLPLLRTEFATESGKTVERARVYATSRGIYELNLNGEKVGDQFLAPGWTDYTKRFQHQTYDVTEQVRGGANSFGAELADGWWSGRLAHLGRRLYGSELSLLARLRVDYTDGTSQWVDTNSGWTTASGPYTFTDNIDGESYDARQERAGWDQPGYDATGWGPVVVRTKPAGAVLPQPDEPVRVLEELPAVERTEAPAGRFIYDVGQNMVGVARMRIQGQAGKTVTIRYAEELNPDGSMYTANLRSAKVTDHYTFAEDGTVTYEPKFTQHGFRYIEISGAATPPAVADVTGVVWGSDLPDTGDLETSDPMLNQLVSNISWGQRGNFLSVPTDTPARDERMGWTGDINVFAPTASYLTDTRAFLTKWMVDLRDSARPNGDLPGVAPELPTMPLGGGVGWSDAMITVPYAVWRAHGDASIVRENYAAMAKYFDFVEAGAGADLIDSARGSYNDWLNLDDPTPCEVLCTAYFAEDARMMAEMAEELGKDAEAAEYAALSTRIRATFTDQLISADGTVRGDSQAGYAMALGMDLVDDPALRTRVAEKFVAKLARSGYHLSTGFLGTPWLLPALSSIGRDDLAYTMLMHKDYPSWGYEVEMGATTMWERWNSIMPDGSFGPVEMNSFNHYAYGAVGDWMYQNIGGIRALEPGYKKTQVAPVIGGGLTHGGGDYDSVYGPIRTDWELAGDDVALTVEVPVNTTAEVVLPAENAYAVTESGELLDDVDGVTGTTDDGDTVTVTVGSGSYDFEVSAGSGLLGSVLEDLEALRTHVADLADEGDLAAADRTHLDEGVEAVTGDVRDALLAGLEEDGATVTTKLESALAELRTLRTWLAGSGVAAPVRADLDGRMAAIEAALVRGVTTSMGVTVTLPPVAGAVLPGSAVQGTIEVTNDGTTDLTALRGEVAVRGLGEAAVELARVPAGESVQLPVAIEVPARQDPQAYDAVLSLTYTSGEDTFTVTDTTTDWVTVTSGLEIGDLAVAIDGADRSEHATVTVPVANTGTADVRARVVLTVPDGFGSVPSAEVLVPAGGESAVEVPVVLPLDLVGGAVPVTVDVRRAGASLVSAETTATFDLPRPPTAYVDHVDFGAPASENAHGIQASPTSGTNVEAGLTRRYANAGTPGAWYSVTVDVPAGEPFLLRGVETYGGPTPKKYHVYVDDVLVKTQLVPRTESGPGIKVYDALLSGPAVEENDGNVRIKFEYPRDAAGFHDPSIADLWVLKVPADTQAPDVSASVVSGTVGDAGWYRSDVGVEVSAVDNRDATPTVETGAGGGWTPYAGPLAVTGDGEHEVTYRATDDAGNASAVRTATVAIDATAPQTTMAATRGAGVEGADSATVTFAATDATSGVASTVYRVDGGEWAAVGDEPVRVEGFGEHVVDFASTDVAGNPEPVRTQTVSLADVDAVAALVVPQVTGAARLGLTLTATPGSWNTKGLSFDYQWLRGGSPVRGATGSTYRLSAADLGKRLSVRVTAAKPGKEPGVATSTATAPVAKATSRTKLTVNRSKVASGKPVKVTVRVASQAQATGKVAVRVDGKVVGKAKVRKGKAVITIKVRATGRHKVTATYLGSRKVARSTSAPRTIRVR